MYVYDWMSVCDVNVCNVCFCACILSYLLWLVSHERQAMLTQWPWAEVYRVGVL